MFFINSNVLTVSFFTYDFLCFRARQVRDRVIPGQVNYSYGEQLHRFLFGSLAEYETPCMFTHILIFLYIYFHAI